ncbi:P-loop containing nucleoside triphosphate hydrolase protein [Pelagophyceae sp. CCMP2097]|nr:P-loop containing nucleoside triphosphate hydrolase protein [Pelagophyceae sp. CCMP2097]
MQTRDSAPSRDEAKDADEAAHPSKAEPPPEAASPFDTAGFVSKWSFLYALPLFRLGARRPLQQADLPPVAARDTPERVSRLVEEAWARTPSIARALWGAFGNDLVLSGLLFFVDFAAVVATAELLRPFVNWISTDRADVWVGALWAAALIGASLVNVTFHHGAFYMLMRGGWNCRIAVTNLMHGKLLRVKASAVAKVSTGYVLSLVTTDCQRFDNLIPFIHAPWVAFILSGATYGLLARTVGPAPAAAGCAVVAASVAVQIKLGFRFKRLRGTTAAQTDRRVKLISELLSGIYTVKAASWEVPFEAKIRDLRAQEAATILRSQHCKAVTSGLYFCTVSLATFALFATFIFSGEQRHLRVGDVVSTIALLNALRQIVSFGLAYFMMTFPEMLVALQRFDAFMRLPEVAPLPRRNFADDRLVAVVSQAAFAWDADDAPRGTDDEAPSTSKAAIRGIDFELRTGEMLAVEGPVGSGKSSLIEALFGELALVGGSVELAPLEAMAVVYAPQRPWVVAGSLRANVLLGAVGGFVDEALYAAAVDACALGVDVALLEYGDQTLLGERGVTLSGGQQARVTLARAVYAALVYKQQDPTRKVLAILDDPLASVDAHVANHIIDRALRGALRDCAVLCVTHSKQCADAADAVISLRADGTQAPPGDVRLSVRSASSASLADVSPDVSPGTAAPPRGSGPVASEDERVTGSVSWRTWRDYAASAGWSLVAGVFLLFVVGQACLVATDYYIIYWTNNELNQDSAVSAAKKRELILVYGTLSGATVLLAMLRAGLFYDASILAANGLHDGAARAILKAPLHFHNDTPRGRILARFASDQGNVDELLSQAIFDLMQLGLMMLAVVGAAVAAVPYLAAVLPPLGLVFVRHKQFVTKSMNECKRLDQITRGPVIAAFADTLNGLGAVRAYGHLAEARHAALGRHLDANARAWFWWLLSQRVLGFYLDVLCVVFLFVLVVLALALRGAFPTQVVALGLLYAVQLSGNFQWVVRQFALAESFMSSVERLLYYGTQLPAEDFTSSVKDSTKAGSKADDGWPRSGALELRDLRVKYAEGLPDVLHGISLSIPSGAKVGIVGRSGSGKSSLVSAFSRLNLISGGAIIFDGRDTRTVPLAQLRKAVAVIPQAPHLFSGTLRFNLDPFGEHADPHILTTLAALHAFDGSEGTLDRQVEEDGSNLSLGERQLLCTARALLLRRRVVCVDEATASVDRASDDAIQRTLREADGFKAATIVVIAHRISTVRDSDIIVVLQAGVILEAGAPDELLRDSSGPFAQLALASA